MAQVQVIDSYDYKELSFQLLRATSNSAQHPTVSITAPQGTVILGGGAEVNWNGSGNMITGMFPSNNGTVWTVTSKDHEQPSPASIVAYCIVAQMKNKTPIPTGVYKIVSQTSNVAAHPTQQVNLPDGFSLVGGGARANYRGQGSLLFASYPTPGMDGWVGSSKDHLKSDPASIIVWAIGLEQSFLRNANMLSNLTSNETTSAIASHPHHTVVIPNFHMTGGGARVNWNGLGNLLTASFPQDRQTWVARGKDHLQPDPSTITTYAVGFRT
jgi:hypothetical protein